MAESEASPRTASGWDADPRAEEERIVKAAGRVLSDDENTIAAHIQTVIPKMFEDSCIYTAGKMSEYMEKANSSKEQEQNPTSEIWGKFLGEMGPVMKRIMIFAKQLPGMGELGPMDQMLLIKNGMFEVCMLHYYPLCDTDAATIWDPTVTSKIKRDQLKELPMGAIMDEHFKLAETLSSLKPTDAERGMMAALCLINPNCKGLSAGDKVSRLQDTYAAAMQRMLEKNRPDVGAASNMKVVSVALTELHRINDRHAEELEEIMKKEPTAMMQFDPLHRKMFNTDN